MNILSITLNMEGLTHKNMYQDKRVWDMILCDLKRKIAAAKKIKWKELDIIFFGLQETDYHFNDEFLESALKKSVALYGARAEWLYVTNKFQNPKEKLKARHSYSGIFYNSKTIKYSDIFTAGLTEPNAMGSFDVGSSIIKFGIKSKAAIFIGRFRKRIFGKKARPTIQDNIIFANAHLASPKDTRTNGDFGKAERINGLSIIRVNAQKYPIVLVGDLNFRIIDRHEQLTDVLSDRSNIFNEKKYWRELLSPILSNM